MQKRLKMTVADTSAKAHPIIIGPKATDHLLKLIPKTSTCIVIITEASLRQKAEKLVSLLQAKKRPVHLFTFPGGEKFKSIKVKTQLETQMFANHCDRNTWLIAFGGGVVGDLAGFIAATYMRGIPYIQVPTTLLAMVDSSIGGKTGVNTTYGKNLIGAIWQPKAVLADTRYLSSLNQQQLHSGMVEAIKMFMTNDRKSFYYFLKSFPNIDMPKIIHRAVFIKKQIVESDEREDNVRAILNFGHSIGHAIEKASNYKILHGIAVGLGILVEAKMAELLGMLNANDFTNIQSALSLLAIRPEHLRQFNINKLLQYAKSDKKARAGISQFILLQKIGAVYKKQNRYIHQVPESIAKQAFATLIGIT